MALSKKEAAKIREEANDSGSHKKEPSDKGGFNKKIMLLSVASVVLVLVIAGFGYSFVQSRQPAPLDGFAKCLTEKGAVMYGATFCQYSHKQEGMFGNSKRFLDIRDFSEDPNVKVTPTWKIGGEYYENVQSLDRLASLTGCKLK